MEAGEKRFISRDGRKRLTEKGRARDMDMGEKQTESKRVTEKERKKGSRKERKQRDTLSNTLDRIWPKKTWGTNHLVCTA